MDKVCHMSDQALHEMASSAFFNFTTFINITKQKTCQKIFKSLTD